MGSTAKNMSLSAKLASGFTVIVMIIVVITVGVYMTTSHIRSVAMTAQTENAEHAGFAGIARKMELDVVDVQQWLTDISATRGLDGLNDGFDEADKSKQSFLAGLGQFKELFEKENDSDSLKQLREIRKAFERYCETGKKMAEAYVEGGPAAGNRHMSGFDDAAEGL